MTCFNRREQTLRCLEQLAAQKDQDSYDLTIFLVDDASTDGTYEAVRKDFPSVRLLRSEGNLYWNQGMRVAFEKAMAVGFNAYLWLNDDTMLLPDAVSRLLATHRDLDRSGTTAIVTGSTYGPTGNLSYGGFCWQTGWKRLLLPVEPQTDRSTACDTMNGNCTLIPRAVAEAVGNLDAGFHHSFGDFDYGFRARAAGFGIYVAPGYFGICSDNPRERTWRDRSASFRQRWRHLNSAKGSPLPEWSMYCRRHLGSLWPIYAASPYVKTFLTAPFRRLHARKTEP